MTNLLFQGFILFILTLFLSQSISAQNQKKAFSPTKPEVKGALRQEGFFSRKKPRGIKLACKHISPIEQSYLSRHVNYRKTSTNLESRVIEQFIKRLDGYKIYLLQGDVDQIKKDMKGFFGRARLRDCNSIRRAYSLLISRVNQKVQFAKSYLGPKFKFNRETQLILDPSHRKYPKTQKEAEDFHRKYIQFQISNYLATDMTLKEAQQNVSRSYERRAKKIAKSRKPENESDLWSLYLDAFAKGLDPHSSHLSQNELEEFEILMRLSLEGIGATLTNRDGFTVVEQLVPGGAADKSGKIKPKDKIIAVGQDDKGPLVNVVEQDLSDVVRKIRGPKGSRVRLSILRKNGKKVERSIITLVRDKIKLEDKAAAIHYVERKIGNKKRVLGLVNLPSFYADGRQRGRSSAKDLKKLLKEAREKKIDGIVLDLSTNGGGALDDAVKIAGLFFKTGPVVKQSHRDPHRGELVLADKDPTVDYAGPLLILTSRISASASEIVAGTLKDYKRAIVVGGDHTFGKGSVQSVEPLPPGLGAIKTTVGMFFTAGGASTQHRGVTADIILPSGYSTDDTGEKSLDYSLPPKKVKQFLSPEAYVTNGKGTWKKIKESLIKKLSEKSKKRVKDSEDFNKIRKNIAKAKKRGKTIKVSEILEEEEKEEKEEKKAVSKKDNGVLSPEERKERYLKRADIQEALNIMVDYIQESSKEAVTTAQKPEP